MQQSSVIKTKITASLRAWPQSSREASRNHIFKHFQSLLSVSKKDICNSNYAYKRYYTQLLIWYCHATHSRDKTNPWLHRRQVNVFILNRPTNKHWNTTASNCSTVINPWRRYKKLVLGKDVACWNRIIVSKGEESSFPKKTVLFTRTVQNRKFLLR